MEKVTTLRKEKGTKNFTKLKINPEDRVDNIINKIVKFIYKDLCSKDYDLSNLNEYLKFNNFSINISKLNKIDSSLLRDGFCKDKTTFFQGYELSIEDCNNTSIQILTNCSDISKSAVKRRWRMYRNSKLWQNYQRVCDVKYLYGMFKLLDITYEYCIKNSTEILNTNFKSISLYDNTYSEEDIISLVDLDKIQGCSALFNIPRRIKQLIIDVAISKQLEDFNITLMEKYNRDIQNEVARAFETKKNIPGKILRRMNNNKFRNYFSYVELDSDTDLSKFILVEDEWETIENLFDLSKLDKNPELRFRKLGKHRALGLYYPSLRCLCVDITSPSSFMHELGHHIDYTYSERPMSLQYEFRNILREYTKAYDAQKGEDAYLSRKRNYFITPTEVFARTFEIYLVNKKVDTSFLKDKKDMNISGGYPQFDKKTINQIVSYFDSFNLNFKKYEEVKVSKDIKRTIKKEIKLEEIKYSSLEQVSFFSKAIS